MVLLKGPNCTLYTRFSTPFHLTSKPSNKGSTGASKKGEKSQKARALGLRGLGYLLAEGTEGSKSCMGDHTQRFTRPHLALALRMGSLRKATSTVARYFDRMRYKLTRRRRLKPHTVAAKRRGGWLYANRLCVVIKWHPAFGTSGYLATLLPCNATSASHTVEYKPQNARTE